MNQWFLDGFGKLKDRIEKERGPFTLFALFAREDLPDRWDLVIAAAWAKNQREDIGFVVDQIQLLLSSAVLTDLSRIVLLQPTDPPVVGITSSIAVEKGPVEIRESVFGGVAIKHAFIYVSRREPV